MGQDPPLTIFVYHLWNSGGVTNCNNSMLLLQNIYLRKNVPSDGKLGHFDYLLEFLGNYAKLVMLPWKIYVDNGKLKVTSSENRTGELFVFLSDTPLAGVSWQIFNLTFVRPQMVYCTKNLANKKSLIHRNLNALQAMKTQHCQQRDKIFLYFPLCPLCHYFQCV